LLKFILSLIFSVEYYHVQISINQSINLFQAEAHINIRKQTGANDKQTTETTNCRLQNTETYTQ